MRDFAVHSLDLGPHAHQLNLVEDSAVPLEQVLVTLAGNDVGPRVVLQLEAVLVKGIQLQVGGRGFVENRDLCVFERDEVEVLFALAPLFLLVVEEAFALQHELALLEHVVVDGLLEQLALALVKAVVDHQLLVLPLLLTHPLLHLHGKSLLMALEV